MSFLVCLQTEFETHIVVGLFQDFFLKSCFMRHVSGGVKIFIDMMVPR